MATKPRRIVRQNTTYEERREIERLGYLMTRRQGPTETYDLLFPHGLRG